MRSETVPGTQLTLRSGTPAARPSCVITFLQRSIEKPTGSPLLSLMNDKGKESADTATLIAFVVLSFASVSVAGARAAVCAVVEAEPAASAAAVNITAKR